MFFLTCCRSTFYSSANISQTPLHDALDSTSFYRLYDFEDLLKAGTNSNEIGRDGSTILQHAISKEITPAIHLLLQYPTTDINAQAQNNARNTPLHEAVVHPNTYIIKLLLSYGANPRAQNNYGDTPLHIATRETWWWQPKTIALLQRSGANPTIKNYVGKTPLDIAIQHKQPQAIINSLYHSPSIAAHIHAKQIDTSQG